MLKPAVLVTGAAGFIGRYVCKYFSEMNYHVSGVGHGNLNYDTQKRWGISDWLCSDIDLNSLSLIGNKNKPSIVVHCGSSSSVAESFVDPYRDFLRSADSTAQVLEYIRQAKGNCKRFVLLSSASVYENSELHHIETDELEPISPYAQNKLISEQIAMHYSKIFGINVSIIRLASVYGDGLRKQLLWDTLSKLKIGNHVFFGTGNEVRNWIHVSDAAELIYLSSRDQQSSLEIYNGGDIEVTVRDIVQKLYILSKTPGGPTFDKQVQEGRPPMLVVNSSRAEKLLCWHPKINIETGLAAYVKWFENQDKNA